MKAFHKEYFDAINRDEQLLSWARYSIRFNDRRQEQARDFLSKLRMHKRVLPGLSEAGAKIVLSEIDRIDRNS